MNDHSPRKGTLHRSNSGVIGFGTAAAPSAATKKYLFLTAAIVAAACVTRNIVMIHIHHGDAIIGVSFNPIAFPVEIYRNRRAVEKGESRETISENRNRHSDGCRDDSNNDAVNGGFERVVLREGHFSYLTTSSSSLLYLPEALRTWQANISSTPTNNTTNGSPPTKHSEPVQDIIVRNTNNNYSDSNNNNNVKHHTQNQIEQQPIDRHPPKCCHMPDDQTNEVLLRMKPDDFCWHAICHTPRACDDPIYPYSDPRQKEYFRMRRYGKSEIRNLRNKCDERNGRLLPPYRWCAQWLVRSDGLKMDEDEDDLKEAPFDATALERYNHQNIDPFEAELPPPGCSTLSQGGGSGPYQNLILFPEGKLAFCGIPKVGITQWIQFLRFTLGARDYRAHPHSKRDQQLLRFDSMREEVQLQILNDPEWKFAVFFRDPEERLLSAYLDKVRPNSDNDDKVANHFKSQFNFTESPTFSEFVETIATNRTKCPTGRGSRRDKLHGADWCADPHWRPQTMSCGISEFLPRISYVGSMNHIQSQTRTVLKGHLWEKYGKYFHWDPNFEAEKEEDVCATPPPKLKVGDALIGFQQRPPDLHRSSSCSDNGAANRQPQNQVPPPATSDGSASTAGAHHHATGSRSKLERFYTPRLRRLVREIYRKDYEVWHLIRNESDVVSGIELAMKISGSCKAAAVHLARSAN